MPGLSDAGGRRIIACVPAPLPDELIDDRSLASRLLGWPVRVLAILVAVALVGWIVWRATGSGGPREADRVVHPGGYSLIKPSEWIAKVAVKPNAQNTRDSIELEPDKWIGLAPSMWVKRFSQPPDLEKLRAEGFGDGTFHDAPALIYHRKPSKYLTRRIVVRFGDDWYELGLTLPGLEATRLDGWWRYIDSFRPAATGAAGTNGTAGADVPGRSGAP